MSHNQRQHSKFSYYHCKYQLIGKKNAIEYKKKKKYVFIEQEISQFTKALILGLFIKDTGTII